MTELRYRTPIICLDPGLQRASATIVGYPFPDENINIQEPKWSRGPTKGQKSVFGCASQLIADVQRYILNRKAITQQIEDRDIERLKKNQPLP